MSVIGDRSDFALRGFHQTKTKIARRIHHAVEIAVDVALRSEHHDRGGMCVLFDRRIVGVLKTNRVRERINRLLPAGQKVPVIHRAGTAILADVNVALGFGERGSIFRLKLTVTASKSGPRFREIAFIVRNCPFNTSVHSAGQSK